MLLFGSKPILLEQLVEFLLYPTHTLLDSKLLFDNRLTLLEQLVEFQLYPTHKL
jgi:hypothetical protein